MGTSPTGVWSVVKVGVCSRRWWPVASWVWDSLTTAYKCQLGQGSKPPPPLLHGDRDGNRDEDKMGWEHGQAEGTS